MSGPAPGLLIAAPASGSGKTVLTLALLRLLRHRGVAVSPIKVGPDYIDPAFHAAASGRPCLNVDGWAMRPESLAAVAARAGANGELVIAEGVMGLFDGAAGEAPGGAGSCAQISRLTGWPVILAVDAKGMAASAAALIQGFASFQTEVSVAGVVFNRVGGPRHEDMLRAACAPLDIPVLGCLPRCAELMLPERHLGLVQAGEHEALERFLETAAEIAGAHVNIDALRALAKPSGLLAGASNDLLPPLGQRIAVARDLAFAFAYPLVLDAWRARGASLNFFSPLADEAPDRNADAVYLPGGYPELHAGRLAANGIFLLGLRDAAARGAAVYGECGGYMVLGQGLIDAEGARHAMAGLLPLEAAFDRPRRSLGYREAVLVSDGPLGMAGARFRGHEFHFAQATAGDGTAPLFRCTATGTGEAQSVGGRTGTVMGSFLHLIDRAA